MSPFFTRPPLLVLTQCRFSVCSLLLLMLAGASLNQATGADVLQEFPPQTVQLLRNHCLDCHGEETQESDLRIDLLTGDFSDSESAAHWIEVMDNLNLGEMPPEGEPKPPAEWVATTTDWIAKRLQQQARLSRGTGGRVLMRRLNRMEYANIVRDLFDVEFLPGEGPADLLPPDGTMNGFDTVSKALLLDPSLMQKYFDVANVVADKAVVTGPPPVPTRRNRMEYEHISGGIEYIKQSRETVVTPTGILTMAQGMRSDDALKHPWNNKLIPVRGNYRLRIRLGAIPKDRDALYIRVNRSGDGDIYVGKVPGTQEKPEILEIERGFDVAGGDEIGISFLDPPGFSRVNYHFSDLLKASREASGRGEAELAGRLRAQMGAQGFPNQGRLDPASRLTKDYPRIFFDWIELEGPLYPQWPPRSTQRLFHRGLDPSQFDETYTREIFERLMPKAFRRPVSSSEVARIARLVAAEIKNGEPYEDAIRTGITAMLCSPSFLLVNELQPLKNKRPQAREPNPRALSGNELAFRLSLFLWKSIPDQKLIDIAASGTLNRSQPLLEQTRRMLADPKSEALILGFARQWLKADEFDRFSVDRNLYRDFHSTENAQLNESINREPVEFFREVLSGRGSLQDFLNSDWTMVNETLARHYEVPDVTGDQFRRVFLPKNSHRGGLTTMAAIHKWGSDGNRTKPVERGKYILDVLFNDPPKPPPPNVGEVEPNVKGELLTVRERLDQHRSIPACANCHRTIDPYGLALEHFNVIGKWRTKQDGERPWWPDDAQIDATGTLPNGVTFGTVEEFRAALAEQDDRFLRGFTEKMFTYALGRIVEPSDHATIESIVARTRENQFSLPSLIEGIVLSDAFQTK